MPKVSIIVPVYKAEKYLHRCIDSLLNQTISDIEVILINDCSPDNSVDIINQYVAKDTRVLLINHEKNQGPMMARYHGYSKATGDYITFCDSDDTLPNNAIETMLDEAYRSGADVISGTVKYLMDNGDYFIWTNKLTYGKDKLSVFKSMLQGEFHHNLCSRLFKRSILQKYKYRNYENLLNGEDGLLFYQIVDNCSIVTTIDSVVYEYRQNTNSSSQRRFTENQINSYFYTCAEQYAIVRKYATIDFYAKQFVVRTIIKLYAMGYSRKLIDSNIVKYRLEDIVTYYSIWHLFPSEIALKYSIKKLLFPIFRKSRLI